MAWFSLLPSLLFLCLSPSFMSSSTFSYFTSTDNIDPSPLCHPYERSALLQFKNSFSVNASLYEWCTGPVPQTASWGNGTTEADCCAWNGVTCDDTTGHVIGLDLDCGGLQGIFHSNNSLFFLRHLEDLDLSSNDFQGSTIPSEFGKFTQLKHLEISESNFSGHIPPEISHLSKLVELDLSSVNHQLRVDTFTLKRIVTNLTNLRGFYMDEVDMSYASLDVLMNLSSSLISLRLRNCRLGGNLPTDYIFHLPKLVMLDLRYNDNLTGSLLTKYNWSSTSPVLKFMYLSRTKLSIDLTFLIQNFMSLEALHLNSCKNLVWNNRTSLPDHTQISELDLSSNNLGGEIPWSSLIHLKHLESLDLSGNSFIGQLPDVISFSSNYSSTAADPFLLSLEALYLNDNLINGTIPSWLSSFKFLRYLELQNNQFTGFNIDEFQSHSLEHLDLSKNKLHGSIPTSIFQLVNLGTLNLSSNSLSGDVGLNDFSLLKSLHFLSISKNQLSGEIPSSICNLASLVFLDLSNNSLNGTIHPCIGNFIVNLSVLNLGMNKLHGSIPLTFAKGNHLRHLILKGNQLGGTLPQSLLRCEKLEVLDVGNNKINDTFPYWLESLPKLQVLILRSNRFHGSTDSPKAALPFQKLEVLDVGNNKINDTFPCWLESLPKLQVLILRSNRFHGSIDSPKAALPFQNLRIMDLSNNEFGGNLPSKYFGNLVAMMDARTDQLEYMGEGYYSYEVSVSLVMKGFTMELVKIQTILTTIDFSNNRFEGEIPRLIGKLKSLKGLNISHNKLTGSVPSTLGNLSNLEWLDLSSNELVGEIPQQLTNMISLSVLNLSRNKLSGPIPNGKQFNTFENSSYSENLRLCGFPLSEMCGNKPEAPPSPSSDSKKEGSWKETYGFEWKIILIGYGSGIVIGVSLGYIVLSNEKVTLFLIRIGFTKLLYA